VQTTPPDIADLELLRVLGEILRPCPDETETSALRSRLLRPGFSWQGLIDLALAQGVLLPLIHALSSRALAPPIPRSFTDDRHVSVRLQRVYSLHLDYRRRQQTQLQQLRDIFARANITPLLLKGVRYLAEPDGDWREARAMGDFDMLVHPGDAGRAQAALIEAGYRSTSSPAPYRSSHHLAPLEHPGHPMSLELHVEALIPAAQRLLSSHQVWALATRTGPDDFFVLPPAWHALHGMLHHQVQDRGHALRKLCVKGLWEWSMLASRFTPDDWSALRDHMAAAGALDVLDSWSMLADRLFRLETPWLTGGSAAARRHAERTLRQAFDPYWRRRTAQIADELKLSFAREALAARYDVSPAEISLAHVGRNLVELAKRHQGGMLRRLTGSGRQS
jgi:hypothetical protein